MTNAFTIPKVSQVAEKLKKDAKKVRSTPKNPSPIILPGSSKLKQPEMMRKR